MHISPDPRRDRNVLAAWALAVSDGVRLAVERAAGLGGAAPAALVAIVADPGMSIDGLRRVLGLTHPGAVRLVDRLVEHDWVQRAHGVGRTIHLEPTEAGRRAERRIAEAREKAVAQVLAVLPDEDLATIARLVDPVLALTVDDPEANRRLCRLCDREACAPCPAEEELHASPGEHRQPGDR
jgi:DNA-binding MarR family transcriptional regulator